MSHKYREPPGIDLKQSKKVVRNNINECIASRDQKKTLILLCYNNQKIKRKHSIDGTIKNLKISFDIHSKGNASRKIPYVNHSLK